ncbi:MAG: alpha/beta fold hydrolase [Propionibacteriaceae bacterium]
MTVPIVLVHPMWFSGDFWSDSRDALSTDTRVETPDLPGYGSAPGPFTADTAVAAVVRALRSTGGPADLVGLSLGARVALAAAAQEPSLVRSLVLMGVGDDVSPLGSRVQYMMMRLLGGGVAKRIGGTESTAVALESVKAQPHLPLTVNASKISCPTLVVAGGADKEYASACQKAASTVPGARLVTMPDAEHMWPKDRPQDFVQLVREWRSEQDSRA